MVNEAFTAATACLDSFPVDARSLPVDDTVLSTGNEYRGVWVWVEQFQGEAASISWEMLGQGRLLADQLAVPLSACVFGQNVTLIREFAISEVRLNHFIYYGGRALYCLLPHFEPFDYKNLLLYGGTMPWGAWIWSLAYGVLVCASFLALASVAWEGRELL